MWDQLKRRSSYQTLPTVELSASKKPPSDIYRELHHPVFQSIKICHNSMFMSNRLSPALGRNLNQMIQQTIVTLNSKVVTPMAMQQCLKFIYSGTIDKDCLEIQVSDTKLYRRSVHSHVRM